jgi:hypothetical protein
MDIDEFPTRLAVKNLVSQIEENIDTTGSSVKVADIILSDDVLGVNHLFLEGEDKDKFELRSDGLYLATGASINFEERGGSTLVISVGLAATGQELGEFAVPQQISVRVVNVDEPGTLSDWTSFPVVGGRLIIPKLDDPDGRITNISYQWQSQLAGEEWKDITGAIEAEYIPTRDDTNKILRVKVSYMDRHGPDKFVVSERTPVVSEINPLDLAGQMQAELDKPAFDFEYNFNEEQLADIL